MSRLGPIPRSVFHDLKLAGKDDFLGETISEALEKLFETAPNTLHNGADASPHLSAVDGVCLLVPKAVQDPDAEYRADSFLGREMARVTFLSPRIQRIAMKCLPQTKRGELLPSCNNLGQGYCDQPIRSSTSGSLGS